MTSAEPGGLPAGIGKPARRALEGAGIRTLVELAGRPRNEIAALHGVGPAALRALDAALTEAGLRAG
ncbi:putative RecB family nuclease [Microbacterium sp. AK009]|uniref:hypothetical protein n=1 Tax=Microbacterium sp. AK009 TaxID=2723068 RepID=UPI001852FCEF|nr:hypothetical protein [Microbacterium sp. AK009]NYF17887.1 putative RecB family nuclease [Microbacterium sp. AK009]